MNSEINRTENATEFKIPVSPDSIKTMRDPNLKGKAIIHAYPLVRVFPNGQIPDNVNPRSHDKLPGRISSIIASSLASAPAEFHLRNRGVTIVAESADYDPDTKMLTFTIPDKMIYGMVDGATTDRTLARLKAKVPEFEKLRLEELPEFLKDSSLHVEIITGDLGDGLVPLASARNTSVQVKEFSLENLGGGFDWLRTTLDKSEFRDRVKYKENDPQPVSVLDVLALVTLFHPRWNQEHTEPIDAYASKGRVLEMYRQEKFHAGYESLSKIVPDILRLYDYIHMSFPEKYQEAKASRGVGAKLGARREVKFQENKLYTLPLTGHETHYLIPDGWLYPILAAMRMLADYETDPVGWYENPQQFFDQIGASLIADVVDQSEAMNYRPSEVGKNRVLYNSLRKGVEMRRLNIKTGNGHTSEPEKVNGGGKPPTQPVRRKRK